jgi:hypothetical protein
MLLYYIYPTKVTSVQFKRNIFNILIIGTRKTLKEMMAVTQRSD